MTSSFPKRIGAGLATVCLLWLAVDVPPCLAQDPAIHEGRLLPPIKATPFLELIRQVQHRNHLPDLRLTAQAAEDEIRVWHGFGLGGIGLLRIQRKNDSWDDWTSYHVGPGLQIASTSAWVPSRARLDSMLTAGLAALPAFPARDSAAFVVLDGFSVVFEWSLSGVYGIGGADNPAEYCSADDRRFIRVWAALYPEALLHSPECQPSH